MLFGVFIHPERRPRAGRQYHQNKNTTFPNSWFGCLHNAKLSVLKSALWTEGWSGSNAVHKWAERPPELLPPLSRARALLEAPGDFSQLQPPLPPTPLCPAPLQIFGFTLCSYKPIIAIDCVRQGVLIISPSLPSSKREYWGGTSTLQSSRISIPVPLVTNKKNLGQMILFLCGSVFSLTTFIISLWGPSGDSVPGAENWAWHRESAM